MTPRRHMSCEHAGEEFTGATAHLYHVRRLREDRARDYRGGSERGVEMAERLAAEYGLRQYCAASPPHKRRASEIHPISG